MSKIWLIFVLVPHSSCSFLSLASLNSGCILTQSPGGQLIQITNIKQTCATSDNEKAERQMQRKRKREREKGMRESLSSADWRVYKSVHRLCGQCYWNISHPACRITITEGLFSPAAWCVWCLSSRWPAVLCQSRTHLQPLCRKFRGHWREQLERPRYGGSWVLNLTAPTARTTMSARQQYAGKATVPTANQFTPKMKTPTFSDLTFRHHHAWRELDSVSNRRQPNVQCS